MLSIQYLNEERETGQRYVGTSFEPKMTKLKLSNFRHTVRRQGPLEKRIMLGNIEGSGERGRLIDSIKKP